MSARGKQSALSANFHLIRSGKTHGHERTTAARQCDPGRNPGAPVRERTALSSLRTGIAVFALPLSVLSVLIATSRFYNIVAVLPFLVPLLLLNLGLVVLGSWLIHHAIHRIHHYDQLIRNLRQKYRSLAEFVD